MTMPGYTKLPHKILAEGEATGHAHAAVAPDASLWASPSGAMVLDAPSGTDVVHQEHAPVSLAPGRYDVSRVKEYDHFAEEARDVVD